MTTKDMDEARKLNSLAGECIRKQDFEGALEYFNKALDYLPDDEKDARARILNNMGHASVRLRTFDHALDLFREAADLFKELGDDVSLGEQLGNIGSVYRDMNEWDLALPNYFDSLEIFEKIDLKAGIAAQYSNISYAFSGKGALQEALEYSIKAKGLFDELGETRRAELSQQNIDALKAALEGR
jgi:tetratricopeptide (TPR) repeat protein